MYPSFTICTIYCHFRYLKPCAGEKIFEVIEPVEDTKGNNGEPGKLICTNLRIVWQSQKYPKINLCKSFIYFLGEPRNSFFCICLCMIFSNWIQSHHIHFN